jgi:hypothetical protein
MRPLGGTVKKFLNVFKLTAGWIARANELRPGWRLVNENIWPFSAGLA